MQRQGQAGNGVIKGHGSLEVAVINAKGIEATRQFCKLLACVEKQRSGNDKALVTAMYWHPMDQHVNEQALAASTGMTAIAILSSCACHSEEGMWGWMFVSFLSTRRVQRSQFCQPLVLHLVLELIGERAVRRRDVVRTPLHTEV